MSEESRLNTILKEVDSTKPIEVIENTFREFLDAAYGPAINSGIEKINAKNPNISARIARTVIASLSPDIRPAPTRIAAKHAPATTPKIADMIYNQPKILTRVSIIILLVHKNATIIFPS